MKVVSIAVILTTLLALVVAWPDDNPPNNELSQQQLDNAVIKADGELNI